MSPAAAANTHTHRGALPCLPPGSAAARASPSRLRLGHTQPKVSRGWLVAH
eukprot:SAG22_NODE_15535_length_346_cov_1.048583_1_plen_50_part_01